MASYPMLRALHSGRADNPFANVQNNFYWSSFSYADIPDNAWFVDLGDGGVFGTHKTSTMPVWAVRGGQ